MNNDPIDALPRMDLREKPFRKYEKYISRALHETYEMDPGLELNMKAHSFIIRFKDAILGFKRYRYHSILFSQNADFESIKLHELSNGYVRIENTRMVRAVSGPQPLSATNDKDKIMALAKLYHRHELEGQTFIVYSSPEERLWLLNDIPQPKGDFDITVIDFGPGTVVMRQ